MYFDLEKLGLSKNEAKVYEALLKLGSSTSGKIIKETGIYVSATYYTLENLIKKGLVTYITKANRKYFQASEPKQLISLIEEKNKTLIEIIDRLERIKVPIEESVNTIVYEGYKGLKSVYDRILQTLKKGEEYYVWGPRQIGDPINKPLDTMLINYHKRRAKKGIKVKIIFSKDIKDKILSDKEIIELMERKFVYALTNSFVLIYADRVINFLYTKRLIAIEIISQEVADSYRKFFKLMWKTAKP